MLVYWFITFSGELSKICSKLLHIPPHFNCVATLVLNICVQISPCYAVKIVMWMFQYIDQIALLSHIRSKSVKNIRMNELHMYFEITKFINGTCSLSTTLPSPPTDSIWAMRLGWKIIRTALCCTVDTVVHDYTCTHK